LVLLGYVLANFELTIIYYVYTTNTATEISVTRGASSGNISGTAYIIKLVLLGYVVANFELTIIYYVYTTNTASEITVTSGAMWYYGEYFSKRLRGV